RLLLRPLPVRERLLADSSSSSVSGLRCEHRQVTSGRFRATSGLLNTPLYTGGRLFDTRDEVSRGLFFERWDDFGAGGVLRRMLAARMKDTPRRRIRWRRNVAAEHDARFLRRGIGHRHR